MIENVLNCTANSQLVTIVELHNRLSRKESAKPVDSRKAKAANRTLSDRQLLQRIQSEHLGSATAGRFSTESRRRDWRIPQGFSPQSNVPSSGLEVTSGSADFSASDFRLGLVPLNFVRKMQADQPAYLIDLFILEYLLVLMKSSRGAALSHFERTFFRFFMDNLGEHNLTLFASFMAGLSNSGQSSESPQSRPAVPHLQEHSELAQIVGFFVEINSQFSLFSENNGRRSGLAEPRFSFFQSQLVPLLCSHQLSTLDIGSSHRVLAQYCSGFDSLGWEDHLATAFVLTTHCKFKRTIAAVMAVVTPFFAGSLEGIALKGDHVERIEMMVARVRMSLAVRRLRSQNARSRRTKRSAVDNSSFLSILERLNDKKDACPVVAEQTFPKETFRKNPIILSTKAKLQGQATRQQQNPCEPEWDQRDCHGWYERGQPHRQSLHDRPRALRFPSPLKTERTECEDQSTPGRGLREQLDPLATVPVKRSEHLPDNRLNGSAVRVHNTPRKFFNSKLISPAKEAPPLEGPSDSLRQTPSESVKAVKQSTHSVPEFDSKLNCCDESAIGSRKNSAQDSCTDSSTPTLSLRKPHSASSQTNSFKIERMVSRQSVISSHEAFVGKAIRDFIGELDQTTAKLNKERLKIKESIEGLLRTVFPEHSLQLIEYGSFVTGLMTPFSDVDLCIKGPFDFHRNEANFVLSTLKEHLGRIKEVQSSKLIESASVPVLKVVLLASSNAFLYADITFPVRDSSSDSSSAFRTTKFVCDCIANYPSFRTVVLFAKFLLSSVHLNESYKG